MLLCPCLVADKEDAIRPGPVALDGSVVQALTPSSPNVPKNDAELLLDVATQIRQQESVLQMTIPLQHPEPAQLGLTFESADDHTVSIVAINDGAVQRYNQQCPETALQCWDQLLSVDGQHGDAEVLQSLIRGPLESKQRKSLTLTVIRPRRIEVVLTRDGRLGVELKFKETCTGALISEIEDDGLLAKWNAHHPEATVLPGDHMLALNGVSLLGPDLRAALVQQVNLRLTVLHYSGHRHVSRNPC
mmetsp:Transcript_18556/g.34812  ORF Transcript_18556/g.34812 Transcript_18556/m.34812 type:complete len:246 (+) Transcript_18556:30-767(+)